MTRLMLTIVHPRSWWRRLLRRPPRQELRGPFEVHPWPADPAEFDLRIEP